MIVTPREHMAGERTKDGAGRRPTKAQRIVLRYLSNGWPWSFASRGLRPGGKAAVFAAIHRRGWIEERGGAWIITDAGREALSR